MWSKFDDQFYLNPKNALIDRDEQDLHIAAIIYCNGQLTDGFIPSGALPMLFAWAKLSDGQANAKAIAKQLVEHSYWENAENGYKIHDFLDWNLSREEVIARREERSASGRRGGQARAKALAKQQPKQNRSKTVPSTSTSTFNKYDDDDKQRPNVYKVYENEIGNITPTAANLIDIALQDYPEDWIVEAMHEAARHNKRSWAYVEAILKNRKNGNFSPKNKQRTNGNGTKSKQDRSIENLQRAYRSEERRVGKE